MAAPLVHQVNVKATPDQIYEAVSTVKGLAAFWTSQSQAEPRVGSIATFGFGGPSQRMRVDELKPAKRVKWTALADFPNWDGTTVTWDISPAENGETGVLFRHADWPASVSQDDLGSINYTWGLVVERLKQYAESGKPNPSSPWRHARAFARAVIFPAECWRRSQTRTWASSSRSRSMSLGRSTRGRSSPESWSVAPTRCRRTGPPYRACLTTTS